MNLKTEYDGRYRVIEELGRGSMGVVYKAFDSRVNRSIALKVMRPDRSISYEFVRRFNDEARAIGQLSHQNIVSVFDRGEDHDTLFIAMELLEGRSLKEVIDSGELTHQGAIKVGIQVAEALDYAHKNGIVHRDIKPSNIIMLDSGQIKITDFGIARIEDPDATLRTQVGQIMGTPCYMSPEQALGKKLDGKSDLFSLGVILYEIATGKKPFVGGTSGATYAAVINNNPPEPHVVNKHIPRQFSQVIMKSMAKDISQRFQNGQEMALELKKCQYRRKSDQSQSKGFSLPIGKKRYAAAAVILLFLIAIVTVWGLYSSPPPKEIATVDIESDPTDAQVFINGDWKGNTPLKLDIEMGSYEIRLSKPNYYHWEAQVTLDQKGPIPISPTLLPLNDGN
ncbi:MAG: serine/threonine-protein kinase [Desulfobacteraceae bacterium]|jgi:serine/threonine protein kinase